VLEPGSKLVLDSKQGLCSRESHSGFCARKKFQPQKLTPNTFRQKTKQEATDGSFLVS
jgi:hypothetical protein